MENSTAKNAKNIMITVLCISLILLNTLLMVILTDYDKKVINNSSITKNSTVTELTDINTVNTNELMVIDESQLTSDILENRNGKIIISRVIGKCINLNCDGVILNPYRDCTYISYADVQGVTENSIVVTYYIYNPDNNNVDDVISRVDYIVEQ
jgi:uncharacterized protein YabN with tetrapyrrole methylase and pyrophosphatase domain